MRLFLIVIILLAILGSQALATTDPLDVQAIGDLYKSLNKPPLRGWKLHGGDPCTEFWDGISCRGSSIIRIKLPGYDLTGNLGSQLSNFLSLAILDLSFNNIGGEIPILPLSLEYLKLNHNNFSGSLTNVFTGLDNLGLLDVSYNNIEGEIPRLPSSLGYLRLNHNNFSGPLANVFTGLDNLELLDLTNNSLTGDLPSSFGSLKNLSRLILQNNKLSGSLDCLVGLPLAVLDIRGNDFDEVPEEIRYLRNNEIPQEVQSELELWRKAFNITLSWKEDIGFWYRDNDRYVRASPFDINLDPPFRVPFLYHRPQQRKRPNWGKIGQRLARNNISS
ncbi:hypothetical protein REPUB_Repub12eG0148700 [Reevesia pubescens]